MPRHYVPYAEMDADKLQRLKDQKTSSYRKCKAEKEEEKRQFEEDQIILEQEKEMLEQSQLKFEKEKQEMKEKYEEQKRELKDLNLSVLRAADKLEEQKCQIEAELSVEKQEIEKRKHRLEGNWISVEEDKFQCEMEMRRIEKIKRKLECAWRVIEDEKLKLKDEKDSYVKEQKQLVAAQIEKLQDAWIRLEEEKFQLKGDKDNYLEEKRHFKVEKQEFEEKVLKCEQEKEKAHTSVCADLTEAYVPRDMFAYDESSDCLDLHITESENEEHCDGSRQLCSSSFAGCALPLIGADLEWQFNQEAANVDTLMTSLGGCVTDYRCEVSRVYDGLSVDKKCTSAISDGIVMDKHGMGNRCQSKNSVSAEEVTDQCDSSPGRILKNRKQKSKSTDAGPIISASPYNLHSRLTLRRPALVQSWKADRWRRNNLICDEFEKKTASKENV